MKIPNLTGSDKDVALDQKVYIEAVFPGVSSADEIKKALENLPNVASQYILTSR